MPIPRSKRYTLEKLIIRASDGFLARWPRRRPDMDRLRCCKLVSHRGEHDNRSVTENTMEAFDRARSAGVWGVELDIRWTRDLHPVVFHDPDTRRIFGKDLQIHRMTFDQVRTGFPRIPHLQEVVQRYGRILHLMVEIKAEPYPDPARQDRILEQVFSGLAPGRDFHLLSLVPEMFRMIRFAPPQVFLPIATTNVRRLSRLALQERYCGLAGHYLLVTRGTLDRHRRHGQWVGTGFLQSPKALYREIRRGVTWIFSDRAAALQARLPASK